MELSLVLWNCDGKKGKRPSKAKVPERTAVFKSTYNSWKQKTDQIPTVVLAQELNSGGLRDTWIELSKKAESKKEKIKYKVACFFLMCLGQKIKFLKSVYLKKIMGDMSNDRYDPDIARIHCSIVTLGAEKILICSWHGKYRVKEKKVLLRKMLIFVDKVKEDQGCVAALVGGDFNLDKGQVSQYILQSVENAHLYEYEKPTFRPKLIDYVIAWPKNRFVIIRECGEIETDPPDEVNPNLRMFDHALIKYNFIVNLKGEWEGEGLVKWSGECGEGEVTLTGDYFDKYFDVKVTGVESGKWKGQGTGFCKRFKKLEIKGGDSLSVNYGKGWKDVAEGETVTLTSKRCKKMNWKGNGQVEWEGAGAEVNCECLRWNNGEQTVTWNGTGSVEWRGKGKATWVRGKLEKWKGSQTVRCADDRPVQWDGVGEVVSKGGEFKCTHRGTWALEKRWVEGVRYSLKKSSKLGWSGRGVVWKVTGKGAGTMSNGYIGGRVRIKNNKFGG